MVNGRPNRRNLAIRRRWQGRNAQDRMNLSYLNKVCRFFLLTAIMLPAGEMQRAMRAISYIVFIKILSIDEWNDLPADRVEATDVAIDDCSEESCYAQFRFLKRDLRPLFIALRIPAQIRLMIN